MPKMNEKEFEEMIGKREKQLLSYLERIQMNIQRGEYSSASFQCRDLGRELDILNHTVNDYADKN